MPLLPAPERAWPDGRSNFAITLGFNGAQSLRFAPVAKETRVAMKANWPHPSFYGGWLPGSRQMGADAFSAQWSMSYLGRDYPQVLVSIAEHNDAIDRSLFGVQLVQPVDTYVMAERITKYRADDAAYYHAVAEVMVPELRRRLLPTLSGEVRRRVDAQLSAETDSQVLRIVVHPKTGSRPYEMAPPRLQDELAQIGPRRWKLLDF